MTDIKTRANSGSVDDFIKSLDDARQQADSQTLVKIMSEISGENAVMWGSAIIGFGSVHLKYSSGRELDWMRMGFSPRKGKTTLYVTFDAANLTAQFPELGKYKIGKGCIYITRLSDVNINELTKLIQTAWDAGYRQPERTDGKEQSL